MRYNGIMTTSRYVHISSEQVFELPDAIADGLTGFRKVEEVEVKAPAKGRKPKATNTTSSKEGN